MKVHHVKKARKDFPEFGIKRGQPYWWWKRRKTGVIKASRPPLRSELTNSHKMARLYDAEDALPDVVRGPSDMAEAADTLDLIAMVIGTVADEYETSANNLPESLQYSDFADGLRNRVDGIRRVRGQVENTAKTLRNLHHRIDQRQRPHAHAEFIEAANEALDQIDFSGCFEGQTKAVRRR